MFVFLTILIWSTASSTAKLLLFRLNNIQVLFFSTLFATLTVLMIIVATKRVSLLFSYKLKDYVHFFYMSFLGVFLYYLFSFWGLSLIPTQIASSLNYLWPIFTILLASVFLREKLTYHNIIAVLISFIGVIIVIYQGSLANFSNLNSLGVLLQILSAVCYALFSVLSKRTKYDDFTSLFYYLLIAFLCTCFLIPFGYSVTLPVGLEYLGLIWFGSFVTGLAYYFWINALRLGNTKKIANMVYLVPFLSLLMINWLVGETILASTYIGLPLIIFGVVAQNYSRS